MGRSTSQIRNDELTKPHRDALAPRYSQRTSANQLGKADRLEFAVEIDQFDDVRFELPTISLACPHDGLNPSAGSPRWRGKKRAAGFNRPAI